ncbi:RIP metalloprotease RseP [bacterium]|nr:RIP metalloprotease RseP [candidate division CSSED10-310 bacterium]
MLEFIYSVLGNLIPIIYFLLVLTFLIFVHELGHFLAARKVGVRVLTFSIGFGPRLFGIKRGDTDYRISAIPFGGYVKLAGEDPDTQNGSADELSSKSVPSRLLVFVAGAAMNAVAAVVLVAVLSFIGMYVEEPVVGWVIPDSPAANAGFEIGDRITHIDTVAISSWKDAIKEFFKDPDKTVPVQVERTGAIKTIMFAPGKDFKSYPMGGITPPVTLVVQGVMEGYPVVEAGITPGDEIAAVNGEPIRAFEQLQRAVQSFSGEPLTVTIKRGDDTFSKNIIPKFNEEAEKYFLGINFELRGNQYLKKYGFFESIQRGFTINYDNCKLMYQMLWQLIAGKESVRENLVGPLGIGVITAKVAQTGFRNLMEFTALISLNLAIINLLPIPILDGGLILFLLIELIRRKPLNEKIQIAVQNIFFLLIIAVALIITYNDVLRFFFGIYP